MDVGKAGWSRSGQCQKLRDRGGGRLPDEERQSDRVAPRERESAAKRGKRGECVSFTIERGGGLAVRYSDERNGSVKYILGRNFLSNFGRGLDEFVARDIASRYPETRHRAAWIISGAIRLPRKTSLRRARQMHEWRKVLLCTGKHAEQREAGCGVSSQSRNYQRNLSIVI